MVGIIGVRQNADRPPETWAMGGASTIKAAAYLPEFHMHARTGPPPIQNNAVEQAPTGRAVCTASDERDERELTGLDIINRLERVNWYGDGAGSAQFVIKNLPDKIACADIAADDARHESPSWGWRVECIWLCRAGYPFRKPNDDTTLTVVIFTRAAGQGR